MDNSVGLLLEGGAMRSVFSAGVIDFFLDKGIRIPNILAISAGAYAGMNYASGQRGRIVDAVIMPLKDYKYLGPMTFLRKGTFFDMDYLFKEIPRSRAPYDFEAFKRFQGRFITSTVNCVTGENEYFESFADEDEFFNVCQAANSLPLIARTTQINGFPMLDGGMADAIPIKRALEEGWKKLVVVLTRDVSYRKRPGNGPYMLAIKMLYRKYPKFLKLIEDRSVRYNESLDRIAELEKEGRAFVIRPGAITAANDESDVEKLLEYYHHGYEIAAEKADALMSFLGNRGRTA